MDFVTNSDKSGARTLVIRMVLALFSFLGVVASAALSGTTVDTSSIQVFAEALMTFLGATGVYFFTRKQNP